MLFFNILSFLLEGGSEVLLSLFLVAPLALSGVLFLVLFRLLKKISITEKKLAEVEFSLAAKQVELNEKEHAYLDLKNAHDVLQVVERESGVRLATNRARLETLQEQAKELERKLFQSGSEVEAYRMHAETMEKECEITQERLNAERAYLSALKDDYAEQKKAFKTEFKSLSEGVLKDRQREFVESNKDGLDVVLKPITEAFGAFKKRVDEVHTEQTRGQGQLENELRHLKEMNSRLSERAENLTSALRNDKKLMGNWGELQLERLLENAGLDKNCYRREANYKTTEGVNQRPDFIIDLPEGKNLIIDSKVSLKSYVDGVNASTEEEALAYLKLHTTSVRNHIKGLSGKSYDSLELLQAPDFVFMFMPNEAAYLAAFEEDPSLFELAYDRKIAVVTPNTLLPILKTVSSLWRIETQNQSTLSLAQSAEKIHKKLVVFLDRFEKMGHQLDTVYKTFTDAKTSLTGRGSLVSLVKDFEEKGVKATKSLPSGE